MSPLQNHTPNESSNKRHKSIVWDHFSVSKTDNSKAICKHCPPHHKPFAYNKGGTTNLMNHLKHQRPHELNQGERDPNNLH